MFGKKGGPSVIFIDESFTISIAYLNEGCLIFIVLYDNIHHFRACTINKNKNLMKYIDSLQTFDNEDYK